MKISVIVPSRLQVMPSSDRGSLYLDRALMQVRRQTCWAAHEWEIIVCMDPADYHARALPERFLGSGVIQGSAAAPSQAAALNEGLRIASGDVVAFLEDDDYWEAGKMATQMPLLERYDMVTSNQREVDELGNWVRTNDFATPSGWVLTREAMGRLGRFDESFKYHVDTEMLGRANGIGLKRGHVVEQGANATTVDQRLQWLSAVSSHSDIIESTHRDPLVVRTVNPQGGMAEIMSNSIARQYSKDEHARMVDMYGGVPW